jgi:hypothetical protein
MMLCVGTASAQADYDPRSTAWNGTSELLRMATEAGIECRPTRHLDWATLQPREAIVVLYPTRALGITDLSAFLEDGGKVAWFDDFGASDAFLEWFRFRRDPLVRGVSRTPELPELLLVRPRSTHVLTEGVDVLVTNIPTALSHPGLTPVFDFVPSGDQAPQGFLLVGQIGRGKLVVGGDPSIFLNTMMRFPGNRQFARNLLAFLAEGRRVHLVWGDTHVAGVYRGRTRARTPVREAVNTLNDSLSALSRVLGVPSILRPLAVLVSLAGACLAGFMLWGRRPSERYGPRGPVGAVASAAERVALYTMGNVNFLVPTLRARNYFERSLLRAFGVRPPADVHTLLRRAGPRLGEAVVRDGVALLTELDALRDAASDPSPPTVRPERFLSLWRRIDAILRALERTHDG